MRPVPPGNRSLNSQPQGRPDTLACGPSATPLACFLTTEANLEAGRSRSPPRFRPHHDPRKWRHGSRHQSPTNHLSQAPTSHPTVPESVSSSSIEDQEIQDPLTCPGTPLFLDLSGPESAVSSTSSRRSSIVGPSIDHHSDFFEDETPLPGAAMSEIRDNDSSVPQLIMPSLTVPRRRPFSHVGKSLGKLKIMVAGKPGIGKTSLVMSLAQRCEHIVHIDQIEPNSAMHVSEFYASSRPHPWWKTDSQLAMPNARRRSSTAGEMLDRNVCFVESPGRSKQDLSYVKSYLSALLTKPMDDADLFALLNAGGEPIVDVLLYLIPHKGLEDDDIEYIKNAQQMTNVVPVLARADELGSDEVEMARQKIIQTLAEEDLECFSFADALPTAEPTSHVYAVSTETRTDYDTMDASVLMDSAYVPPLVQTDLSRLVSRLFSLDGSAQLRHTAAAKSVEWRRKYGGALQVAIQQRGMVHGRALRIGSVHRAQCWERLDFYNWANNLRQSLHTEQLRYILSEKAVYGAAPESRLVRIASPEEEQPQVETSRGERRRHQDPLGILEIGGKFKQRGMFVLEMVTSIGIIGYVITRLVQADWAEETCSVAFAGTKRVGMEIPGLGTVVFW
ncbi:hypothetical protein B0T10DRAFT_485527 [Thelonectria olida]|uniref:Septin-type G domain-containing protein n=1 Tax=Thelonectria olida TaxID=1576542 RepID=A0A9P8W7K2_9HYPO|nr:hypothetical protein B0T10DRAFT_485527 [Thelonectria olida]